MTTTVFVNAVTLTDAAWFNDVNNATYEGSGLGGTTTIASAASPDIFAATTSAVINYTGTATATSFTTAPRAGSRRTLVCAGAAVFTAGSNMIIDGTPSGSNFTAVANQKILVYAITTTQFSLTPLTGLAAGTLATTFTFNGSGGTSASKTLAWQKNGDWVTLFIPAVSATSGTASSALVSDTALPAALRPLTTAQTVVSVIPLNNGTASATPGVINVNTTGTITLQRDGVGTTFTNSTTCGIATPITVVYFVGTGS